MHEINYAVGDVPKIMLQLYFLAGPTLKYIYITRPAPAHSNLCEKIWNFVESYFIDWNIISDQTSLRN